MNPWVAFAVTLSVIILVHEWGHFLVARRIGVKVDRFSLGFGPRLFGVVHRGTDYCLCLLPFGGYVKLAGEASDERVKTKGHSWEYRSRSVGERFLIVLAGPAINYLLGFFLFFIVFMVGAPVYTSTVGQVLEDFPAAEAGLQVGDQILAIDEEPVEFWEEMTQLIRSKTGSMTLTLEREGERLTQVVEPKMMERKSLLGKTSQIAMIGITPSEIRTQRYPLGQALFKAGYQIWFLTKITLQALFQVFTGALSFRDSFLGPVGIFKVTSAVAEQGILSLIQLMAVLSTSIGLFNLFPIPVLDGGHLAFLAAEKIKGKPVSIRTQETLYRLGLAFLLLIMVAVTYNDFMRFNILDRFFSFFKP